MSKLHPIKNDIKTTLWCGPAALATITGRPVSECMQAIRDARNWGRNKPIKGVSCWLLEQAAKRLGLRFEQVFTTFGGENVMRPRPTLAAWTRENKSKFADAPVLLIVTGHYVTVAGNSFNDNHTRTPVRLRRAPHRRKRVKAAWRVVPAAKVECQTLPVSAVSPFSSIP